MQTLQVLPPVGGNRMGRRGPVLVGSFCFSRGNGCLVRCLARLTRGGDERLTGKRLHHVVFGSLVVVWVKFDVQLIADGKLILQVLYGSDATEAALHHDGQTCAQGFAFFEADGIN